MTSMYYVAMFQLKLDSGDLGLAISPNSSCNNFVK